MTENWFQRFLGAKRPEEGSAAALRLKRAEAINERWRAEERRKLEKQEATRRLNVEDREGLHKFLQATLRVQVQASFREFADSLAKKLEDTAAAGELSYKRELSRIACKKVQESGLNIHEFRLDGGGVSGTFLGDGIVTSAVQQLLMETPGYKEFQRFCETGSFHARVYTESQYNEDVVIGFTSYLSVGFGKKP